MNTKNEVLLHWKTAITFRRYNLHITLHGLTGGPVLLVTGSSENSSTATFSSTGSLPQ